MSKIELAKDIRKVLVEDIKNYFLTEREEEMGDLSAEFLLDFILETIGPHIYNRAINDAHTFMSEKTEDLFALEKPVR
ncbi:MAG TPA: DUF2164 domain-containing protein [Firmicutes bacterium]|nr:DUF2164 domain-containing protein [Bacillota bacterium]